MVFPFVVFGLVPAGNFVQESALPDIAMHTFYHRRTSDLEDDVPRISGLVASQWAVTAAFARRWW
jgi:hypothetical protein